VSPKTLETLRRAIELELANPAHASRTHGRRYTYRAGCHGPLCRRANREYMRRWINSANPVGPSEAHDREALMLEYLARIEEASAQSA
jgi:hypothetical protein